MVRNNNQLLITVQLLRSKMLAQKFASIPCLTTVQTVLINRHHYNDESFSSLCMPRRISTAQFRAKIPVLLIF